MTKTIGYARTSTKHQDFGLDMQIKELQARHVSQIFSEQISGRKRKRKELSKALKILERGDTLLVYKIDRLGRSALQILQIISDLHERDISVQTIIGDFDTSTAIGRLSLGMQAIVSQYESDANSERVRDIIKSKGAHAKKGGRPKSITSEIEQKVVEYYANPNLTVVEIVRRTGISRASVTKIAHDSGLYR